MNTTESEAGKVVQVRVFIDRAAVTRRRVVAPATTIVFGPLSSQIDTESLRASAVLVHEGQKQVVRVNAVSAEIAWGPSPTERHDRLREELDTLTSKLDALQDNEANEQRAVELLTQYAQQASAKLSLEWLDQNPSFDRWNHAFDLLRQARARLASSRAERLEEKKRIQAQRIELLEEERTLGQPTQLGYRVHVNLTLPENVAGALEIELTYLTPQAQWMAAYDARHLTDGKERLQLSGIALVRQNTGEDWQGITLIATTARPPLAEPPPQLSRLLVQGRQGHEDKNIVSAQREEARLGGAGPGGQEGGNFTVEHVAPGLVNIPATNRAVRVALFQADLPAKARLEVAPMARPVPILVAELENSSGRVLLPGRVQVFRGPNYAGQTELGFVASGERFRLALGTDATLRIQRLSTSKPEKKALITGNPTNEFEIRTTLENLGATAIEVLVRERVPVSKTEDATVKVTSMERGAEMDPETGLIKLLVTVPPRSKRELPLAFKVTAPRGFRLVPPTVI